MKILFIVQGEGRGHLTQAITLEQMLRRHGHEVVEVLVGESKSRHLPGFFNRNIQAPVKRFASPNFQLSQGGKQVNLSRSILQGLLKLPTYLRSMSYINRRIRETNADLVVNFYELLVGFTFLLFRPRVPQVCIGHQYLFLHKDFKLPSSNKYKLMFLRLFTRLTCMGACEKLALSFRKMDDDVAAKIRVVPPLLRQEVLACEVEKGEYLHGYLLNAGFSEEVCRWHERHPQVGLHFFWGSAKIRSAHFFAGGADSVDTRKSEGWTMNQKELNELRRRFRADRSAISRVYGCYVNGSGEIISYIDSSLGAMPQEESEK